MDQCVNCQLIGRLVYLLLVTVSWAKLFPVYAAAVEGHFPGEFGEKRKWRGEFCKGRDMGGLGVEGGGGVSGLGRLISKRTNANTEVLACY